METIPNNNQVDDIEANDILPIATKVDYDKDIMVFVEPINFNTDSRVFENVYVQNASRHYINLRRNIKYESGCLKLFIGLMICILYIFLLIYLL